MLKTSAHRISSTLVPRVAARFFATSASLKMKVIPVPCRSDNYMYIIKDDATGATAVVDPYDVTKLEAAASAEGVTLGGQLITTHHHNDHSGGNEDFLKKYPKAVAYGGSNKAPGTNTVLKNGDKFKIGELDVTALSTPCHTQDHICFFVEDGKTGQKGVFTGDTLFISGCGRFFEGTATEMDKALNSVLAKLPDETVTYVGHEYTKSNVAFSLSVEPHNADLLALADICKDPEAVTTGKSTIADEKKWNPFMRLGNTTVQLKTGQKDPIEVMQALREMKNNFKG